MQLKTTMAALGAVLALAAPARTPNYDESKIAPYTLEDPLTFADGRKLTDKSQWEARRAAAPRNSTRSSLPSAVASASTLACKQSYQHRAVSGPL